MLNNALRFLDHWAWSATLAVLWLIAGGLDYQANGGAYLLVYISAALGWGMAARVEYLYQKRQG